MRLEHYLRRVHYLGSPHVAYATLAALHRAHLTTIAYENLDIHLGRPVSLDVAQIYDKIVRCGRGGWCYEMNSLFAWALREVGFEVTMLGAAVGATTAEGRQQLDHMVLMVTLDEPWLVDVGFGNAFLEPLPLREGFYHQGYHTCQLRCEGDYWCYRNLEQGGPGFDFLLQPRLPEAFEPRCAWLQSSPESRFMQKTVCHRQQDDHTIHSLHGAVLTTVDAEGRRQEVLDTLDAYHAALTQRFALHLSPDETLQLWEEVWPAHLAWIRSEETQAGKIDG